MIDNIEPSENQEERTTGGSYPPILKSKCRAMYVAGTHYLADISKIMEIPEDTVRRWRVEGKWLEARDSRLKDRASVLETQLDRLEEMITGEIEPRNLAQLSSAYEKLYGVYAWMRGLPRPGVSQTAKPTKSRGKFEAPE